jgi:hypothetical protein
MTKLILMLALLAGPSFAEKTGTARPKLAEPPPMDMCDASDLKDLIGQPLSEALQARAQERSGARVVRILRPGQAVTMDYSETRLNIEVDAQSKIISVGCG